MADMNSTPTPSIPRTRSRKSKSGEGMIERSASTPKGKSATVLDFEFARAYSALKKTPGSRRQKCLELLREQADLEIRLRTVRSMLDAVINTPIYTSAAAKPSKQTTQSMTPDCTVIQLGRD
ncbi:MAG: hypothetical protein IPG23_08565 [Burkholderiales bacterium]|jgi:hypothetical protein|nr:hypothetical protein [Burkholderiales bacterium]